MPLVIWLYIVDGGVTIVPLKWMLLIFAEGLVKFAKTPEALQMQIDKLYHARVYLF